MAPDSTESMDCMKDHQYLGHPFEHWVQVFRETHGKEQDRHQAAEALASFGEKSIPFLMNSLKYENYRLSALNALVRMGRSAFDVWIPLMQSSNPSLRKTAVRLLK